MNKRLELALVCGLAPAGPRVDLEALWPCPRENLEALWPCPSADLEALCTR